MPSKRLLIHLALSVLCITTILYAIGVSSSKHGLMQRRFCLSFPSLCGRSSSPTIISPLAANNPASNANANPQPQPPSHIKQPTATSTRAMSTSVPQANGGAPSGDVSQEVGVGASAFSDTLLSLKEMFVKDLEDGKGEGWTVVMGNEAGDLDSLASAIAFSYLSTTLLATPKVISLLQTPRSSLPLRPENTLALSLATLSSASPKPASPFLCIDELPIPASQLASRGVSFALVDHNRLLPAFAGADAHADATEHANVTAVIDHHQDENLYPSADPRIVTTDAGSCASLVALYFKDHLPSNLPATHTPLPKELATLLITAILIDTGSLKPNGKATSREHAAVQFLYPLSSLFDPTLSAANATISTETAVPESLTTLGAQLLETKKNVSHLTSAELLGRDYKQYLHPTYLLPSRPDLVVGLATVPIGLEEWLTRKHPNTPWASLVESLEAFSVEHGLHALGVLTSFRSLTGKVGKHKREILLYFPQSTWAGVEGGEDGRETVWKAMVDGLEANETLDLKKWKDGEGLVDESVGWGGKERWGKVWRQGNADATRKVTAPVVKDILEGAGTDAGQ